MANELLKEKIGLNHALGRVSTQILEEGDIIVPDIRPDMDYILKVDADVTISKTDVSPGRVGLTGRIAIKVLYLAKGGEKPPQSILVTSDIADIINMEGVSDESWVEVSSDIANVDYTMLSDRKLSYRVVVDVNVYAESREYFDAVSDITDLNENQVRRCPLSVKKTIENRVDRINVKDELALPQAKPNIRELLQTCVTIANKEVKVSNGRVAISGELIISILYKGDDDENIIEFFEQELPFSGHIEAPYAQDGVYADVTLTTAEQYIQARPNADGEDRLIDTDITLNAVVRLYDQSEVRVLEDAYIVNHTLDFKKERVTYPRLVCRNKNQYPVKEIVELDAKSPDILQIVRSSGRVLIDDVRIIDDKVIIEGVVDADVLYIAKSDENPLYNYHISLPFRQTVETKGARDGMEASIDKYVDHVGFNMLSDREIELRFLLAFNTSVVEEAEAEIITSVEFGDLDPAIIDKMPSITIYVVSKGDTLWSVAKRFNTSIEDILAINDLSDGEMIFPGQKLIILKRNA